MKKLAHFFKYYFWNGPYWTRFILFVILASVLYFNIYPKQIFSFTDFNTWVGFFGTVLAVYILMASLRTEWVEALPKKLTVHFICNGKYVMSVVDAPLLSKADIRAWAQQLGLNMNDQNLDLRFFELHGHPKIKTERGIMHESFELHYYIGVTSLKKCKDNYLVRYYYDTLGEDKLLDYNYEQKEFGPHRGSPVSAGEIMEWQESLKQNPTP